MEISRQVAATELEELNVGTTDDPRTISIAKNLPSTTRFVMITLLYKYRDVFSWSHEDVKGLEPKFVHAQTDSGISNCHLIDGLKILDELQ